MQLDQLKLFIAVAVGGSFSRAATLVGSTQSAVSKRLLALEQELKCRLFERTGRGARLTDAGRILLPRAEALLGEVNSLGDVVAAAIGQPRGTVRFAVQQSVSWPLVGYLYQQTSQSFPNIKLQISEAPMTQIDEWLREGRVDVALVSRLSPDASSHADALLADSLYLISAVGDRVTRNPTIAFARLPALPLIVASLANAGRVLIEEEARRRNLQLHVALELNSMHLIKRLVAIGAGYAVATRRAVATEIAAGTLSASKIVRPRIQHPFYLTTAANQRPSAAVRAVADLVREAVRLEPDP